MKGKISTISLLCLPVWVTVVVHSRSSQLRPSSRSVDSSFFQEIRQRAGRVAKLMIREKGEKSVVRRNVDRNIYFLKSFNFSTEMACMIGNGANICWQRKRALQVEEKRKKKTYKRTASQSEMEVKFWVSLADTRVVGFKLGPWCTRHRAATRGPLCVYFI